MNEENVTALSYLQLFYYNMQTKNDQQFSNMAITALNFCKCYKNTGKEQEILKSLYHEPMQFILKKYRKKFDEKQHRRLVNVKLTLLHIDWLFYRDTVIRSKLLKPYRLDSSKPRDKMEFNLGDIVDVLGLLKIELTDIVTKIAIKNEVKLKIDLPQVTQPALQPVGIKESDTK